MISATLSPSALALVIGQKSAKGVWDTIEKDSHLFQDPMFLVSNEVSITSRRTMIAFMSKCRNLKSVKISWKQ
jgi:hypothetical protein